MAEIDIGTPAIDRPAYCSVGNTLINVGNPANDSGFIKEIQTFAHLELNGCYFGIFYNIGGLNFKCRSAVEIGIVAQGYVATPVNLAVVTGDYIGMYAAGGAMDRHDSGGDGYWYDESVNNCVVDNESAYVLSSGRILSLYGETVPVKGGSRAIIIG